MGDNAALALTPRSSRFTLTIAGGSNRKSNALAERDVPQMSSGIFTQLVIRQTGGTATKIAVFVVDGTRFTNSDLTDATFPNQEDRFISIVDTSTLAVFPASPEGLTWAWPFPCAPISVPKIGDIRFVAYSLVAGETFTGEVRLDYAPGISRV